MSFFSESPVLRLLSRVSCHISHVSRLLSRVFCHMSAVTYLLSHVSCLSFHAQYIRGAVGRVVISDAGGHGFKSYIFFPSKPVRY